MQIALALLQGLVAILLGVVWKLRDADKKATAQQMASLEADVARANAKAEKATEIAVSNLERIHQHQASVAERLARVDKLEAVVELSFSAQNTQLDRIEAALGSKVSRGEFKAATRRDERSEPDTDPPPVLPQRSRPKPPSSSGR